MSVTFPELFLHHSLTRVECLFPPPSSLTSPPHRATFLFFLFPHNVRAQEIKNDIPALLDNLRGRFGTLHNVIILQSKQISRDSQSITKPTPGESDNPTPWEMRAPGQGHLAEQVRRRAVSVGPGGGGGCTS
jgi:hypothetical protein